MASTNDQDATDDSQLAPGEQEEQRYRSAGATDAQIDDWRNKKTATYKEAGATDDQIKEYFGHVDHDPKAMKAHVTQNLAAAKAAREPIDASVKPIPAEDFIDSLAAGWGTGVTALTQNAPVMSMPEHASRMMKIGNMIGQMTGDVPAMAAGWAASAPVGAFAGGVAGSVVPGLGTLGGIALGSAVAGAGGAMAAPAGIRKLYMDHYEKGDIKDRADFMDRLSAASWESIKAGTVGGLTGGAGWSAGVLTAGAKPLTAGIANFGAELATMATSSAAMEKRLPEMEDFENAAILMGGLHGIMKGAETVPKLSRIFKATGETPQEITQAVKTDPILAQDMATINPDLPKIQVPSAEEQAKLGLKPVDENGNIIQEKPTEANPNPKPPTVEEVQSVQAIQVAKEAADEQKPPREPDEPSPPVSSKLSDDEKEMLNYVGASVPKEDTSTTGAIKRDLVKFWKTEGTSRAADDEGHFQSEFMGKVSDSIANYYINTFDYTKGLGRILGQLGKDPKINKNPEALATLHSEIMTKVAFALDKYTSDFKTGEKNGEGYKVITDEYHKEFPHDPMMDKLRAFGMAARVVEKARQGMDINVVTDTQPNGEPIDVEMAKRILKQDKDGKLEAFNQRRIDFRNRILKYTHDSGFWSEDEFEAMKDQNEKYMSFHRVQETDPLIGKSPSGGRGVFRMKGTGNLIVDPLVSDIKDTQMLIQMANENRIKQTMVENMATGHDDAFLRKVEPDMKITKVSADELSKELTKQGIDHDEDALNAMNVFRSERARNGPTRMEVHINGERQVYEGDADTIDLANRLRGNPPAAGMFSKMLATAAAGIRAGTINAWAFATKHTFRNQITGGTYSETGMLPMVSPAMHAMEFAKGSSQDVNDFFYHGGAQSSYQAFDDQYIQSKIFKIDKEAPFMGKIFNYVQNAAQFSHVMILNNDNLIRFSEFKGLRAEGKTPEEAAYGARRVLPDVQTAGLVHSALLAQTAFLGIHVRSMVRQGEAVADQIRQSSEALDQGKLADAMKGPLARAIGMITVPATLLAAANYGSQRIDRLLPWQKYGYFNWAHESWNDATPEQAAAMPHDDLKRQLPNGQWQIDNGTTWKMQMPFTQGVFFGGLVQSTIDAFAKKSPKPFEDWIKNVAESTIPSFIPNVVQPVISQTTNYNTYTGQHVIPDNKLQLAPELQYEPYTTDSAKAIGKLVGYVGGNQIGPNRQKLSSPMIVEEYVRDWTGPIGMGALRLADMALGKKKAPEPTWEWGDYPAVGAFAWRNDTAKTSNTDEFISRYQEAMSNRKSVKEFGKEGLGNSEEAQDFKAEHDEKLAPFAGKYKAINNMKRYVQYITANPDMDSVTKRQLIEPVYYRMDEVAKQGVKLMDDRVKAIRDAKKAGGQ